MDLDSLRYAVEVRNCGSINRAAARLFMTQPHLSACIKALEKKFGVTLFIRSSKGVQTTPEGDELLDKAEEILLQYEMLENRYTNKKPLPRSFRIVSVRSVMVAEAFWEFYREQYLTKDFLEISFTECGLDQVIDSVAQNDAHLGILMFYPKQREYLERLLYTRKLKMTGLGELSACIILSRDHALANADYEVLKKELPQYPYATYGDYRNSILDAIYECAFGGIDLPERIVYVNDRYSIMDLIHQTDAFSVSHVFSGKGEERFGVKSIPVPTEEHLQFGCVQLNRARLQSNEWKRTFLGYFDQMKQEYRRSLDSR